MARHKRKFNHQFYTSGGVTIPQGVGDRYFGQDMIRDHRYLQGIPAAVVLDLLGLESALISGGVVTEGSTKAKVDVTAAIGLCGFDVSVPDDDVAWAIPAIVASAEIKVRVSSPALADVDLAAAGATLNGSAVNYLKLRYSEADVRSRDREFASGSYPYSIEDSYLLVCDTTAPTGYDVLLASIVGDGSTLLTINQALSEGTGPSQGLMMRDMDGRSQVSDPVADSDIANLKSVSDMVDILSISTVIDTDTILTEGGRYLVKVPSNITLPESLDVGKEIEIYSMYGGRILQAGDESIIEVNGLSGFSTTKGITNHMTGSITLKPNSKIRLMYIGNVILYTEVIGSAVAFTGDLTDITYSIWSEWSPDGRYLAVFTPSATLQSFYLYKRTGDVFVRLSVPSLVISKIESAVWTPDGELLVIVTGNTSPYSYVYKRTGDTLALVGSITGIVPTTGTQRIGMSHNGMYLVVTVGITSPYANWFKRNGDNFDLIGNIPSVVAQCIEVSWSYDDKLLILCNGTTSPYAQLYKRTGDTLALVGGISGLAARGVMASWNPNTIHLVISNSLVSPYAQLYKRTGDTLALIGSLPSMPANGYYTAWSPDGRYLAISSVTTSPYVTIYKLVGDVITIIGPVPGAVQAFRYLRWSPDGKYVIYGTNTISPYVQMFSLEQILASNGYKVIESDPALDVDSNYSVY